MSGVCTACGTCAPRIERHHIAGRVNDPLTVGVCRGCHLILTDWQRENGVILRRDQPRTEPDRCYALLAGSLDLLRLACLRQGAGDLALVAVDMQDAARRLLPVTVPVPPYVSLVEVEPVRADPAGGPERVAELHRVVAEVAIRLVPGSVLSGRLRAASSARLFGLLAGPNRWTVPLDRAARDVCCAAGYLADHVDRLDRAEVDAREVGPARGHPRHEPHEPEVGCPEVDGREVDDMPPAVAGAMLAVHAAQPVLDLLAAAVPPEARHD